MPRGTKCTNILEVTGKRFLKKNKIGNVSMHNKSDSDWKTWLTNMEKRSIYITF